MKSLPFREESRVLDLDNPQRLARVCGTHVVIQPQSRSGLRIPEAHDHFTSARALHVDVRRLMLSGR
jgi:hypothetical protein